MFSKLAKSAGRYLPQARNGFRQGRFEARLMCAQAAASKTTSSSGGGMDLLAMKHINELSAVGPGSDKLDAVVREHVNQLQAANLKDQDAYCQYTSASWDSLNPFVREAVRAITVAARDKATPRSATELANDHAAVLKTIDPSSFSIEKAVWMVDLMLCERIKLNSDEQEKYVSALSKSFPDAINRLSAVQGLGLERSEFLQEVTNLAKNILPRTKDVMDLYEINTALDDRKIYKQEGAPITFTDDYDLEEVMAKVRLAETNHNKSPEIQQKVSACLGHMRSLHDVSSLKDGQLLRLEGTAMMDLKDKLSLAVTDGSVAGVKTEMENFWYHSCLTMSLKKTSSSVADVKRLFPGAVDVYGPKQVSGAQTFLVKFDSIDDLVSVSETLGSDDNISYDCVAFHRPVGNEVHLIEDGSMALQEARAERWAVLNDLYYGKDRDLVNFPMLRYHEDSMKNLRYKIIPEAWFDAMYNKTGVSGPHFTLYAFLLFLYSKQYLVLGIHQIEIILSLSMGMPMLLKWNNTVYPFWQEHALRKTEAKYDFIYTRALAENQEKCEEDIAHCKDQLERLDLDSPAIQAMSENVGLQLEAEYRERLDNVHNAVKKRLDYFAASAQANKQFHIEHMANWIIDSVNQSVTPQLEKDIMKQCFSDLAALSKKHAGGK